MRFPDLRTWSEQRTTYGVQGWTIIIFFIIAFLFMQTKMAVVFFLWPSFGLSTDLSSLAWRHFCSSVPPLLLWALSCGFSVISISAPWWMICPRWWPASSLGLAGPLYTNNLHHLKNTQDISSSKWLSANSFSFERLFAFPTDERKLNIIWGL